MSRTRLAALAYVDLGWSPVPLWTVDECTQGRCPIARNRGECDTAGKHPRIRWNERDLPAVDLAAVEGWWSRWPHAGVGILTGSRSGIDVVDVDTKAGAHLDHLGEAWPELAGVWTVRTGQPDQPDLERGWHLYLQRPDGCPDTSNSLDQLIGVAGVDYRGDGGLVVAPPTLHTSGVTYDLEGRWPPPTVPMPAALVAGAADLADARKQQHAEAQRIMQRLAEQPAPPPANGVGTPFGKAVLEASVDTIRQSAQRAGDRVQGRHATVLGQARKLGGLVPTGHLDPGHTRRLLVEAAQTVVDPGRHADMARTVDDGLAYGVEQPWEPPPRPVTVLEPPAVEQPDTDTSDKPVRPNRIDWRLDEFLAQPDPPVTYRIERLWPADGRVLLAAQYKAGKTTLIGNLLRTLVDGDPFLGRYPVVRPAGVYLIDDELHPNTLRRWLREQQIANPQRITVPP